MMHDLKKVEKKFLEFLKTGLDEKIYDFDEIKVTEDLLVQQDAIYIPFGYVSYFLAIDDEKPMLYAHAATRMDLDLIVIVDENGYEIYDVFDGNRDISERYYSHFENVKRFKDTRNIMKIEK